MEHRTMDIDKMSITEGAARFWSALFGGITAIGLVVAGIYTLIQYFEAKEKEREVRDNEVATLQLQIATTKLSAKQAFNSRHLELCAQASGDAGILATSKDESKKRLAKDDFWQLYWGPLGIVEESDVATAMVSFGHCLEGNCAQSIEFLSLNLAHACRAEVSRDFQIELPAVPNRPLPAKKER
jgi:hypothetical protein